MSAIAFYDSGRLLPYRHDLKQKQIEQRNVDAENTRKYIGYAGGAFANMAERTGTIFGARLGSASQEKDATGAMVDVPQKYGGGTTGAEYAKADWQKGVMDDENHRRKVTHKLGLLTENVKYSTLRRKHEAWGGIDDKAAQEQFDNRWDQYHLDAKDGAMTKAQLIQKYHDFFEPEVFDLVKEYNAKDKDGNYIQDEDTRAQLLEGLNQFSPYSRWLKYAEENKLYDPTVAGKPRPEVDLLMAFLKDEVKFPGINEMLANRDDTKDKQKLSNLQQEQQKNPNVTLLEQLLEKRKGAQKGNGDDKINGKTMLEKQDLTWSGAADKLLNLPENLVKAEKQEQQNIIAQNVAREKKLKRDAKYEGTLKEREQGLGGYKVGDDGISSIKKPALPDAIDFNIQPHTIEERSIVRKHFGSLPLDEVFINVPTVDVNGKVLDPLDKAIEIGTRLKDSVIHKLTYGKPFFVEPSDAEIYGGVTEADKRNAAEIMTAKLKEVRNQAILKSRMDGTDKGEWKMAENKIEGWWGDIKGWLEANLIKANTKYDGLGGLAYIEKEAERIMQKKLFDEGFDKYSTRPNVSGDEFDSSSTVKASMITSKVPVPGDPAKLSSTEQFNQSINAVIRHEDPDLSGRVIDDSTRAILGGSVDAWEIVDKDPKLMHHVMANVLKIKNPAKVRQFINYFKAENMDEYLGHLKKNDRGKVLEGQKLTDAQSKRRKSLKLSPDQTKALVTWAYNNNLETLTNSHGFLNKEVLKNNPSLHQLLGDMAYRHGGSFMTSSKQGYRGIAEALNYALNPSMASKEFNSREDALAKMDRLLFGQGTYGKKNKKISSRYHFLQDRFQRFKANTDGINVASKLPNEYGGGTNVSLVSPGPDYTKKLSANEAVALMIKNNQGGLQVNDIPALRFK